MMIDKTSNEQIKVNVEQVHVVLSELKVETMETVNYTKMTLVEPTIKYKLDCNK